MDAAASLFAVSVAANECFVQCVRAAGAQLMEPHMLLELEVPETHVGAVLSDLTASRGAAVRSVDGALHAQTIFAEVPVSRTMGYDNVVRQLSSGTGSFCMEFLRYAPVQAQQH